jgi:hypothetical protein
MREPFKPRPSTGASGDGLGDGGVSMTTILDKLLAEKQALLERLQAEDIGPAERDEIERLLENVEAALQSLDRAGPSTSQP